MKSLSKLTLIIAFFTLTQTGKAETTGKETSQSLYHLLENKINFPDMTFKEKQDVIVIVSLTVNPDGGITVHEANSTNNEFRNHVLAQLTDIKIDNTQVECGQSFCYKFKFHYIK